MARSGMEMLVEAFIKASGLDVESVKNNVLSFAQNLQSKVDSLDKSMQELRDEQRALREILMEGTYTFTPVSTANGAEKQ